MISNQIGELDAYGNKYGLGVGVTISKENLIQPRKFSGLAHPIIRISGLTIKTM